jgi:hypothetical protein
MTKQPRNQLTISGWYEHTDGTWGHYSWRVAAGVVYMDCDVVVPRQDDTTGPSSEMLQAQYRQYADAQQREAMTWCELALQGDSTARAMCLALLLGQRQP